MFINKALLVAFVSSLGAAVTNAQVGGTGTAFHFNNAALPSGFSGCGATCPDPNNPFTLRIALSPDVFSGPNSCCSTITVTYNGITTRGTYAYKSTALAGTSNISLDERLFATFANPNTTASISPVTWRL